MLPLNLVFWNLACRFQSYFAFGLFYFHIQSNHLPKLASQLTTEDAIVKIINSSKYNQISAGDG
jgi:hypothetical protein